MQATLIVKNAQTGKIVSLFQVPSLDDKTVNDCVGALEQRYPKPEYTVDASQIYLARQSLAAA